MIARFPAFLTEADPHIKQHSMPRYADDADARINAECEEKAKALYAGVMEEVLFFYCSVFGVRRKPRSPYGFQMACGICFLLVWRHIGQLRGLFPSHENGSHMRQQRHLMSRCADDADARISTECEEKAKAPYAGVMEVLFVRLCL